MGVFVFIFLIQKSSLSSLYCLYYFYQRSERQKIKYLALSSSTKINNKNNQKVFFLIYQVFLPLYAVLEIVTWIVTLNSYPKPYSDSYVTFKETIEKYKNCILNDHWTLGVSHKMFWIHLWTGFSKGKKDKSALSVIYLEQ